MKLDRILGKKLQRLNILKGSLVARDCTDKEEIKKQIRDTVDDLELIIDDISDSDVKERLSDEIGQEEIKNNNIEDIKDEDVDYTENIEARDNVSSDGL